MQSLQRYAWVLGVLGFSGLVVFGSLWYVNGELGPIARGVGIATGLLLAAWALLDREAVTDTVSSRGFRFGIGSTVLLAIVAGIGVFGYALAKRYDHRWDLTEDQRFTLSDQTLEVIDSVAEPVEVYAFFRNETPEQRKFRDLVTGYSTRNPNIRVQFVDPLREPLLAEQFTITTDFGTVVLQQGESRQRLESSFDETALTNALIRLQSGVDHTICWSTGHGEADPDDDRSPEGYGAAIIKLEDQNYTVRRMPVALEGIDRACEALLVVRPTEDWLPYEREALAAYVAEGGRALVLLEPEVAHGLTEDLERYGVRVGHDLVLDPDPANQMLGLDPSFPVLRERSYEPHPITDGLAAMSIFGIARSVSPMDGVEGIELWQLARASETSWGETDLSDPQMSADPTTEIVGNVPLAVAAQVEDPAVLGVVRPEPGVGSAASDDEGGEDTGGAEPSDAARDPLDLSGDVARAVPADFSPEPGGRLVVFGDSDFASNQLLAVGNNQDLFLNSVAWLVDETSQLGERPEAEADRLSLTMVEEAVLWLVSLFLVPGAAILSAIVVHLRRRFL